MTHEGPQQHGRSGGVQQATPLPPIILVDVYNLAFRSHYAYRGLEWQGRQTGMLYGFLKALLRLWKISRRVVCCWDHGVPGDQHRTAWQRALLPEYKAARRGKESSPDARVVCDSLPVLYDVLGLLGLPSTGVPGLEADDLIGILSHTSPGSVYIYSTDHDMYQLLTPDRRVCLLHPNGNQVRTAHWIEHKYGIPVARWPVYLALGGDSSDGIKPRPGMGPATAARLTLAGLEPTAAWGQQPRTCRLEQLRTCWPRLQVCYRVARIPVRLDDPRIHALTEGVVTRTALGAAWPTERYRQQCLQRFIAFCSEYGMDEFLAARHRFFIEGLNAN